MKSQMNKALLCASVSVVLLLTACEKKEADKAAGPAETAGKQLDKAAAQAATELNKMADHAGKALEKAGETLQKKSQEAKQADDKPEDKK